MEAPLWTETVSTLADIEYMAFPRLPAIAELGWSPRATHDWRGSGSRLAAQGPRWAAAGITFHPSPEIPWPPTAGGTRPHPEVRPQSARRTALVDHEPARDKPDTEPPPTS